MPLFISGMKSTAWLTTLSIALSLPLAIVLGAVRRAGPRPVRVALDVLVELVRGIPLLVFLFWLYFGVPTATDAKVSSFTASLVGLVLYGACYASEIVRGVLEGIPRGQHDAARSLHLGPWLSFRSVIVPQALPILLPRFGNMGIELLKGSSLVALVGFRELNFWTKQVRAQTNEMLEPYLIALVIYFGMALVISLVFRVLESMTALARIKRRTTRSTARAGS
jgi:polar amino acid transport system permease protein